MRDESPEAVARRAADAQRKREERARAKEAKATAASQEELHAVETIQDFWSLSLRGVDPEKLAAWQARQKYVEALLGDVRMVLEGRQPDEEFIEDVDQELRDDIKEYGIAGVTVPMLIGKFWLDAELLERLASGDTPSSRFAKFGLLTALDDFSVHKWNAFIATHRRSKQPQVEIPQFYVSLTCSLCNAPPTSVSSEVAAAYRRTNNFTCQNCRDKAAQAREFAKEQRSPEHEIRDGWGRLKDQATTGCSDGTPR